jgi:hypothetical protein
MLNYRASTDEDLKLLTRKTGKEWPDSLDDWEGKANNFSMIAMIRCFSDAETWD